MKTGTDLRIGLIMIDRAHDILDLLGEEAFVVQLQDVTKLLDGLCKKRAGVSRHNVMMEMAENATGWPIVVNLLAMASIDRVDWLKIARG